MFYNKKNQASWHPPGFSENDPICSKCSEIGCYKDNKKHQLTIYILSFYIN
jgi:hypothetical protein